MKVFEIEISYRGGIRYTVAGAADETHARRIIKDRYPECDIRAVELLPGGVNCDYMGIVHGR